MSRVKIVASLGAAIVLAMLASLAANEATEDIELKDLDVTGWACVNQVEGTTQKPRGWGAQPDEKSVADP